VIQLALDSLLSSGSAVVDYLCMRTNFTGMNHWW